MKATQVHTPIPFQTPESPESSSLEEEPKMVEVNADDFVRLRGQCRGRAGQVGGKRSWL